MTDKFLIFGGLSIQRPKYRSSSYTASPMPKTNRKRFGLSQFPPIEVDVNISQFDFETKWRPLCESYSPYGTRYSIFNWILGAIIIFLRMLCWRCLLSRIQLTWRSFCTRGVNEYRYSKPGTEGFALRQALKNLRGDPKRCDASIPDFLDHKNTDALVLARHFADLNVSGISTVFADASASSLLVHIHQLLTERDVRSILLQIDKTLLSEDRFFNLQLDRFICASRDGEVRALLTN
jgi:hypothetical protein